MSNYIPTPFIFIGFNKDAIAKIFLDPNSLQTTDIIKKIKEYSGNKEDFLLFENYANPNFLRLQHTLGLGGSSPQRLEIELVDPNNEFEKRVMMSTSYPDCVPFELLDSSGTPVSISDSQKLESKVRKDLYLESINKYVNSNVNKPYYIAYGVGTNPRYWAGPFRCDLVDTIIETTDFKKVTCIFTQNANGLSEEGSKLFNKKAKNATNSFGLKRQVTGISKPLLFSEYIEGKSKVLYDPYALATKESESIAQIKSSLGEKLSTRQGQKISLVSSFIKLIDFHSLVTDCIASYVAKATGNDNVIVLLPNLNSILATSEGFADLLSSPQASTKGIFLDKKLDIAFRIRLALSDALSYLNQMSFVMYPSESSDLKQDFSKLKTTDAKEVSWVTNTEKNQDKDARLKAFFKENSFYSVIDTVAQDNNTIDHYAVLLKFIDELNRLSNTLQMNLAFYFESDVKVLNVLKEYYDKGDPALRFPSSFQDVVVIVGDRDMIKKYLYANEPIQNSKNDLLDTKVQITIQGKNDSTGKPTAVTNAIQLYHPKDKLFFTKDYNSKISDVVYPPDENPPFGPLHAPPDIFAYKKTDDIASQGKLLNRYTIFRYNTANSNVLKIKTDMNLAYLTELKTGFQKELFKSATTKLAGVYSDNYTLNAFLSEEAIIGYIQNKLKSNEPLDKDLILKQVSESLTANGIPSGLQGDPKTIAANCLALAEGGMVSKNRQTVIIDAFSPKNPALIMSDMSNTLYKKSFVVVLETLPMFHLNDYSHLHSTCMLFAQSGKLMTSDPLYETDPFAVFLSGLYTLAGIKHVIEEGRMYSEFTIIRNQKTLNTNQFNKGKTV